MYPLSLLWVSICRSLPNKNMTAPQSKKQSFIRKLLMVWLNSPFWEAMAVTKSYEILLKYPTFEVVFSYFHGQTDKCIVE